MNKTYLIWPFAGLLVFAIFYLNFTKGFEERQHKVEIAKQEEKRAKILKDAELKKKAIEDAIVAQQKRMADRTAKEKKEQEEKDMRAALIERRNRAFDDVNKRLKPQLDRLKNDADEIKDQIAKLDLQKKTNSDEEAFLRTYVRQAETNLKTYYDMLDKIAAAEKAHADTEAAAKKKQS